MAAQHEIGHGTDNAGAAREAGSGRRRHRTGAALSSVSTGEWSIAVAVIVLLSWAPLPLASHRLLPAAIIVAYVGVVALAWAVLCVLDRAKLHPQNKALWFSWIGIGLVTVWIFLQWATWTPNGWHHPIWIEAANALGQPLPGRISASPDATWIHLTRFLAYLVLGFICFQLARSTRLATMISLAVIWIGTFYAVYGLVTFWLGNQFVFVFPKFAYLDYLTGPFVNRNSFAAYLGIALITCLAYMLERADFVLRGDRPGIRKLSMSAQFILRELSWVVLFALLLTVALLLTASRAGVACSFIGCFAVFFVWLVRSRASIILVLIGLVLMAVCLVIAYLLAGDLLTARLSEQGVVEARRMDIYAAIWASLPNYMWTGIGFGAFPDVFPSIQAAYFESLSYWNMAHNTYLETLVELGVPAAILLHLGLLPVLWLVARGIFRRRQDYWISLCAFGATTLLALHGLVDFSLQIEAVTVLYVVLLGLGAGQSFNTQQRQTPST